MAKKLIPVKAIEPYIKADTTTIKIEKLGDYDVIIKDTLEMADMLGFVDEVVENVIDIEADTYYPELQDFFIDAEILIRYANFKLPSDLTRQYSFIANNQDIVKTVKEYINQEQLYWIIGAIDEKIGYTKAIGTSTMASQFNELTTRLSDYFEQSENLFGDISPEDLASVVRTLGNPEAIDEGKIVKAVFDSQKE